MLSKILAPVYVLCLRLTGYSYFKELTVSRYYQIYKQAHNRNLIWVQIEGTFIIFLFSVFTFLPKWVITLFKKMVGNILFFFMSSYKKVIKNNLQIAFKDHYSDRDRDQMARKSLLHSLDSIIWLFLETAGLDRNKVMSQAKVTGYEHLQEAIDRGKGVILCAPHYSRFLFPAFYCGLGNDLPVNFIIRRIDNPLIGEFAYLTLKHLSLQVIIRNHWALKKSLYALKRHEVLFLLMDQNVAVGGVFVPFYGVPASTSKGVHYLQSRTQATVLCCHVGYRNGVYEVDYSPILPDKSLTSEEKILAEIHNYFEKSIARSPEQHLWMHPRWKKRPPGEPSLYPDVPNLNKL